jgi:(2Fe-2S) ferredoxin
VRKFRLSVCKGVTCRLGGADDVYRAATETLKGSPMEAQCEARRGGCWGMCHLGPNVVMREDVGRAPDPFRREDYQLMGWQEETLYGDMTPEKVARLIREHIETGQPVADLATDADPSPTARTSQTG